MKDIRDHLRPYVVKKYTKFMQLTDKIEIYIRGVSTTSKFHFSSIVPTSVEENFSYAE